MKIAVISDIHGNMDAFRSVLRDIDHSNIDIIFSLGDHIGYGPEPEQVIQQIKDRHILSILGNHELAILNHDFLNCFNPTARFSLEKTIDMLSDNSVRFIGTLNPYRVFHGIRFVHGFPPDSSVIYLFQVSEDDIYQAFNQMNERICFLGHTHELQLVEYNGCSMRIKPLCRGVTRLNKLHRYLINIGSVGQPRDGNNNAKYVIWDSSKDELHVRFIPYDINKVAEKILLAGLPEVHAMRLL